MRRWLKPLRRLQLQLILWTILPLTLILVGVAFTGVYSHERSMRRLVEQRDTALAQLHASQIEDLLYERSEILHTLSYLNDLENTAPRALVSFDGGLAIRSGEQWLLLPDADAWGSRRSLLDNVAGQIVEQGKVVYSPAFPDATLQTQTVLIGAPGEDDEILVGAISLQHLGLPDRLAKVEVGSRGAIYLIDALGCVVIHQDHGRTGEDLSAHSDVQEALAGDVGFTQCMGPDNEQMVISFASVALTDWRVVVEEPWADVTDPILRLPRLIPMVAGLAVAVALLALYFGVRYVARPLQTLAIRARSVTWGDFTAIRGTINAVEEIEELQQALREMAARIQDYQEGMRDYIAAITQGQEAERSRLARELHDDTAQSLIALGQRLQMAQRALDRGDVHRARDLLIELRELTQQGVEDVRRFSRDLRPTYLEELGFLPALDMLVRGLTDTTLEAELQVEGTPRRLAPDLELAAYRIAQEALNNTTRHSRAKHVTLRVRFSETDVSLVIQDDGSGFAVPDQPGELAHAGHFGLLGMRERAILLGGQLRVSSEPGRGTRVEAHLPANTISGARYRS